MDWTFWHEAFHAMKKHEPELYADLLCHVEKTEMFSKAQMDDYRAEIHRPHMNSPFLYSPIKQHNFDQQAMKEHLRRYHQDNVAWAVQKFSPLGELVGQYGQRLVRELEKITTR